MRRGTFAVTTLVMLTVTGCGQHAEKSTKELSERQRDSIIATEKALPGSGVVGRALAVSDSEAARAQRMNEQTASQRSDEGK
ncbi:MAG TPA: hypothetical protein VLV15_09480 [Dongiaceae bacterium]|nr:hypothetical protein [Dongiaceae bacterium]